MIGGLYVNVYLHDNEVCQLPKPVVIQGKSWFKPMLKFVDKTILMGCVIYRFVNYIS